MKSIKRSLSFRLIAVLAGAALFGVITPNALAAGTPSGTTISNNATLSYAVGGVTQTAVASGTASFVVDNKVNLTVTQVANLNILPNSSVQALRFTVTNNGNTAQSYALSAVAGAFTATMGNVRIYRDSVTAPGVWDATDTLYVDATTFGSVAPDTSLNILIVADQTAPTAVNGQTAIYSLLAQTTNTGTTTVTLNQSGVANTIGVVDVVFADIAGVVAGDVATDGKHSASATYTVALTLPTIVKAFALLCDPITAVLANAKNIPGSITQWSIVINNPSATAVTLTSLADVLDTVNLTMDPGGAAGLTSPGTAAACVAGAGPYGFKVVSSVSRLLGGSAVGAGTESYFTTTTTADGLDFATPNITATFATILPIDVTTSHPTAGLLNAGESVSLYFNTILK
jgi:hypothetical protein